VSGWRVSWRGGAAWSSGWCGPGADFYKGATGVSDTFMIGPGAHEDAATNAIRRMRRYWRCWRWLRRSTGWPKHREPSRARRSEPDRAASAVLHFGGPGKSVELRLVCRIMSLARRSPLESGGRPRLARSPGMGLTRTERANDSLKHLGSRTARSRRSTPHSHGVETTAKIVANSSHRGARKSHHRCWSDHPSLRYCRYA
jgi:hypothetical protein